MKALPAEGRMGSEAGTPGSLGSVGFRASAKSRISGHAFMLASPISFLQECLNTMAKLKKFTENNLIPQLQSVSIHLKLGAASRGRLESRHVFPRASSSSAEAELRTFAALHIY